MHDVDAIGVLARQFVSHPAGSVRAAVVDHKNVHIRAGLVHPAGDQRQILQLVVGGDDHQGPPAG